MLRMSGFTSIVGVSNDKIEGYQPVKPTRKEEVMIAGIVYPVFLTLELLDITALF